MNTTDIRRASLTLLCVMTILAAPRLFADAATDARLDSLERKLDARGLLDMLNRVEQMQQDIQQLRGDIEVQSHALGELQRRSREQYLDIDRRMQQLETGKAGTGKPGAALPPVAAPDTPPLTAVPPSASQESVTHVTPPPSRSPGVTPPSVPQAGERAEYDQALAVLREGRYEQA